MTTLTDPAPPPPPATDDPAPAPDPEPAAPPAADADPAAAPYGRRPDGSPRRRPGPPKGTRAGAARPGARRRATKRPAVDYRTAVLGILQPPAAMLGMAALALPAGSAQATALLADAAAITEYAPQIADALDAIARENPAVAAVLERIGTVGPYGALIFAVLPLALQLAANHAVLPAGLLGTVAPAQMAATMTAGDAPA